MESEDKSFAANIENKTDSKTHPADLRTSHTYNNQTTRYMVTLYAKAHGLTENEARNKLMSIGLNSDPNKVNRFRNMEEVVTTQDETCVKCGTKIDRFTEASFHPLAGYLCIDCDPIKGSKKLGHQRRLLHATREQLLIEKRELEELQTKTESYENLEKVHELLLKYDDLKAKFDEALKPLTTLVKNEADYFSKFASESQKEADKDFELLWQGVRDLYSEINRLRSEIEGVAVQERALKMRASDWIKRMKPKRIAEPNLNP
jgi:hypothetical protein